MKALVTLDNGDMFTIDLYTLLLTTIDTLGRPSGTTLLQYPPVAVPGHHLAFTSGDGMDTTKGKVVTVIYFR
jgi:hypothetical protein